MGLETVIDSSKIAGIGLRRPIDNHVTYREVRKRYTYLSQAV